MAQLLQGIDDLEPFHPRPGRAYDGLHKTEPRVETLHAYLLRPLVVAETGEALAVAKDIHRLRRQGGSELLPGALPAGNLVRAADDCLLLFHHPDGNASLRIKPNLP